MKVENIVILVGGRGSRLGSLTLKTPKPLIKINRKPFLDHLICKLIKYNFKNIFLLCSYKKKIFFDKYHNKYFHNSKIICIDEGKQKGTGGALYKLKNKIKSHFILINGDTFFDIDYNFLKKTNISKKNIFMCLTNIKKTHNNLLMNKLLLKKKEINISYKKTNLANGGIYLINKRILNKTKNQFMSFENDILKNEIENRRVIGKYFNDFFIDIGSLRKLRDMKKNSKQIKNNCFFLDRDGVINKENGYIKDYKDFIFLRGVHEAIKYLNNKKFIVIIITNQAAVGRGIISEEKLNMIHNKMINNLHRKNAYIDDIYYAPYFKNSKLQKYKENKYDRKPNIGMFLKAIKKWNIDTSSSYFIGDKVTDKMASDKIGIKFHFKKHKSLYKQIKEIVR